MAEAFVRTLKRDYVRVNPRPDAQTVIEQLPGWLAHYNEVHPHRALGYRSPREYIAQTREAPSGLQGATTTMNVPDLFIKKAYLTGRAAG
jgi:putative transposase